MKQGHPNLAVANIVGSNIANIALVLGLVSVIKPIEIKKGLSKSTLMLIIILACVAVILFSVSFRPAEIVPSSPSERFLMPGEGLIMIGMFIVYVFIARFVGVGEAPERRGGLLPSIFFTLLGGVAVWACAEFVISALIGIAAHYNLSEVIIGATLIAIGTSLPEMTLSIMAAVKGKAETGFGNLVSSNVFNITVCLGAVAVLGAFLIGSTLISFHIPFMIIVTIIALAMAAKNKITRRNGIILLALYALYIVLMIAGEPAIFTW